MYVTLWMMGQEWRTTLIERAGRQSSGKKAARKFLFRERWPTCIGEADKQWNAEVRYRAPYQRQPEWNRHEKPQGFYLTPWKKAGGAFRDAFVCGRVPRSGRHAPPAPVPITFNYRSDRSTRNRRILRETLCFVFHQPFHQVVPFPADPAHLVNFLPTRTRPKRKTRRNAFLFRHHPPPPHHRCDRRFLLPRHGRIVKTSFQQFPLCVTLCATILSFLAHFTNEFRLILFCHLTWQHKRDIFHAAIRLFRPLSLSLFSCLFFLER